MPNSPTGARISGICGRRAQDGGRQIAPGDVDQDALAELDLLQIVAVGAQRFLAIGSRDPA